MVLVGPSGCGKSTALRMVAGLEHPSKGAIMIGDRDVAGVSPAARDVAMVFQSYALYPHMTVRKNLAFPLERRRLPRQQIRSRVAEVSEMLGLAELLDRKPAQLSGGQRQRVAMGRALSREPIAFLLDEPLSNLDAKLRAELRAELKQLHARVGTTMIFVTHDQVEAMTLGDRIAVLDRGQLQQVGRPEQVYGRPCNLFVARFGGSPAMNILPGPALGPLAEAGAGPRPAGRGRGDGAVDERRDRRRRDDRSPPRPARRAGRLRPRDQHDPGRRPRRHPARFRDTQPPRSSPDDR